MPGPRSREVPQSCWCTILYLGANSVAEMVDYASAEQPVPGPGFHHLFPPPLHLPIAASSQHANETMEGLPREYDSDAASLDDGGSSPPRVCLSVCQSARRYHDATEGAAHLETETCGNASSPPLLTRNNNPVQTGSM
ncbi:unnamed protein product [Gadus morhua 'NCC']